jgi:Zn-finger nucleic acid-binding protein
MWLSHEDLRRIVEIRVDDKPVEAEDAAMQAQGVVSADGAEQRSCPECAAPMSTYTYAYESGVQIDQCSAHGIWLDAGELDRIEAWVEGNERLASGEMAEWRIKLEQIEQDQEAMYDAEERKVVGPISGFLDDVAGKFGIQVPGY